MGTLAKPTADVYWSVSNINSVPNQSSTQPCRFSQKVFDPDSGPFFLTSKIDEALSPDGRAGQKRD
jgi:hypothetical protein